MRITKFFISFVLAISILMGQAGGVFAAPASQGASPVGGAVQSLTLETDSTTGVTTVIVRVLDENQQFQDLRIALEDAITLGLVALDEDGNPTINDLALGQPLEIDSAAILPNAEEDPHPVGNALATFFSDIPGIDYDAIMSAHEDGIGFGVIAQALWLTTKLEGDSEIFAALLHAKQSGDYSAFVLEDGSTLTNWGQLRKAILDGTKKNGNGVVMSDHGNQQDGNDQDNNKDKGKDNGKEKDKDKDSPNNGNGKNKNQ